MSRVRFPPSAPVLSSKLRGWFCSRFCTLCSLFGLVELADDRPSGRPSVYVAADDLADVLLFPPHDLGDDTLRQAGGIETGRRCAAQIVEVQIAICHPGADLGAVERSAKPIGGPWPTAAIGQDCGRPPRDALEDFAKGTIERDKRFATMLTLAGRDGDRVIANVRPGQAKQIAKAQTGMRRQIDCVRDLRSA